MLELLNIYRIEKLRQRNQELKGQAKLLLKSGDLGAYIRKLTEVQHVKLQLVQTATSS